MQVIILRSFIHTPTQAHCKYESTTETSIYNKVLKFRFKILQSKQSSFLKITGILLKINHFKVPLQRF